METENDAPDASADPLEQAVDTMLGSSEGEVLGESENRAESESSSESEHPAYDFVIDLGSDNTHANVIRMVGASRRVLELGPATGYMTEILSANDCSVVGIEIDADMAQQAARFCERVIVGNLDELDLKAELGDERFDVIVAADVLEHLKDPLGMLRRLRPFLAPEGFFVVSLPNIAHAGVRLALLQGRFEYRDLGLLDRTHLRFFTHATITEMFDEAELAIVELHRQEAPVATADVQVDMDAVSEDLVRSLEADSEARTYQFVVKAMPLAVPGLREVQHRMHALAEAKDVASRARDVASRARDVAEHQLGIVLPRTRELEDELRVILGREAQLTASLIEAHDQVLRRDEEIERLQDELRDVISVRDRVEELDVHSKRQADQLTDQVAARDESIVQLRLRLDRILNSPPARIWARVGRLPLLRSVVAKRTAGYQSALRQAEHSEG
jgi:2-polyprenyl-3-methyl-5-hydroxy-6-metoxy-1,4-benzoquinol methylase